MGRREPPFCWPNKYPHCLWYQHCLKLLPWLRVHQYRWTFYVHYSRSRQEFYEGSRMKTKNISFNCLSNNSTEQHTFKPNLSMFSIFSLPATNDMLNSPNFLIVLIYKMLTAQATKSEWSQTPGQHHKVAEKWMHHHHLSRCFGGDQYRFFHLSMCVRSKT